MNLNESDLRAFLSIVRERQPVLISSHVHPDPDAIGSVLGCRLLLRAMGVEAVMVMNDPVPPRCRRLPGAELVSTFAASDGRNFASAIVLDSGSLARIGEVAALLSSDARIVNIDHHASNDRFGHVNLVDTACAATAELLFSLSQSLQIGMTPDLADCLYAGILTDTGRFRHGITSGRVLRIAAELVDAGAHVSRITNDLYFDLPSNDVLSIGAIYSTLEFFADGRISTLFVRREHLVEDPDSVVDSALSIRGVEVSAMLSEAPDGKIRVSLRSKDRVNVALIAESFGGGGHERAAGFRMKGTLESVRERLLPVLENEIALGTERKISAAM